MIAFGGASLSGEGGGYGFGRVDQREELMERALDFGIKLFDTAPIYGFGESERFLGEYFKQSRENVEFVSKAGVDWHENGRVNMSNRPEIILKMLEQSLRDLNSDYIDIYMIHWPDEKVDIRYSVEVLAKAQVEGKVKKIGLCNTNDEEINLALEVANIEFVQSECNLFHNAFEKIEYKLAKKMGWGVFDKGILAGSVDLDRKFDDKDCRSWAPWWKKSNWKDKVRYRDEFLNKDQIQCLALHYALNSVDYVLIGAKTTAQLEQVIELSNSKPRSENLDSAEEYFSKFKERADK